ENVIAAEHVVGDTQGDQPAGPSSGHLQLEPDHKTHRVATPAVTRDPNTPAAFKFRGSTVSSWKTNASSAAPYSCPRTSLRWNMTSAWPGPSRLVTMTMKAPG